MNDNDIIKALECCKDRRCDICVRQCNHFADESICRLDLIEHALCLIDRLKTELLAVKEAWRKSGMDYIDLNAEWEGKYKTAKAEAIKEFAERLNKQAFYVQETEWEGRVVDCEDINNLVKELTEVDHE